LSFKITEPTTSTPQKADKQKKEGKEKEMNEKEKEMNENKEEDDNMDEDNENDPNKKGGALKPKVCFCFSLAFYFGVLCLFLFILSVQFHSLFLFNKQTSTNEQNRKKQYNNK
jgi:hypothetical protein